MLNQKPLWNETLLLKNLDQNNPKRKIEKRFLIKKKKLGHVHIEDQKRK